MLTCGFASHHASCTVAQHSNSTITAAQDWMAWGRGRSGPDGPSSIMWMYHSHVNEVRDTYSGLQGPIVVTRRGMARPAGSPEDMDRELVALFQVTNENDSWLFHCHINDHILAGMQARYQVPELASHPPPAQAVLHDAAMAGRERMRFA